MLKGMKIAILGYGEQGRAAYEYWHKPGNQIIICDANEKLELPDGLQGRLGSDYLYNLSEFDLLIRTPALHPRDIVAANPETPDILNRVTTVTNEFMNVCPSHNIIGVTGTKGKGTTSTLIAKMLEAMGKKVHLGGNIGTPPLDMLKGTGALHEDAMQGVGEKRTELYTKYGERVSESATQQSAPSDSGVSSSAREQAGAVQSTSGIQPNDWIVLELANFQLIDLKKSPTIAVCLIVVPEHMDWHGDMNDYLTAKQQLFARQTVDDIAIYYGLNASSEHIASVSPGHKIPYMKHPGADVIEGVVTIDGQPICEIHELKLLGQHNWQNVCAAVTVVWQIDQNVEAMRSVLTTFSGLPHRLEFVREVDGIKYYDDSFGTNPETAIVAIEAFNDPKVVILGGSSKGATYEALAATVIKSNVRSVVTIGDTGANIAATLRAAGFEHIVDGGKTMQSIVDTARSQARAGDSVLLSTGCASFGLFKNYKDRGEQFKAVVQALVEAGQSPAAQVEVPLHDLPPIP